MNRNQAFGMNNSLSSNIFNGTGQHVKPKRHFEVHFFFLPHPPTPSVHLNELVCHEKLIFILGVQFKKKKTRVDSLHTKGNIW